MQKLRAFSFAFLVSFGTVPHTSLATGAGQGYPKVAIGAFALICLSNFMMNTKEPSPVFEYKFDKSKGFTWKNIKNLFHDFRGQKYKPKSIPVGEHGDKLQIRKKDCPPAGWGIPHLYLMALHKSASETKDWIFLYLAYCSIRNNNVDKMINLFSGKWDLPESKKD